MKPAIQIIISVFITLGLVLPAFSFAQEQFGAAMPQTAGEAKDFAMLILSKLPEAVVRIWRKEALPVWQKMWEWAKPTIDPWWQKFSGLLGKEVEKRRPDIEKQFQEEKEEIQKDLWQRFRNLIKQSI